MGGVIFVIQRLSVYRGQIDVDRFGVFAWAMLLLLSAAYGAANIFLARAWRELLAFDGVSSDWRWVYKTYGQSQLAKYVPGNIFHLMGRQALGMAAGLPARSLAKSALWELGLISFCGALFGVLAAPLLWPGSSVEVSLLVFVALVAILFITAHRLLSPSVAAALIWQLVFLALSAAVFIGVLAIVTPSLEQLPALSALCGAYVIAWLAGLLTPGAPAGVGVREMVLLFLFKGQFPQADLLLAVVLGRGVTMAGDVFYFLVSTFLKSAANKNE